MSTQHFGSGSDNAEISVGDSLLAKVRSNKYASLVTRTLGLASFLVIGDTAIAQTNKPQSPSPIVQNIPNKPALSAEDTEQLIKILTAGKQQIKSKFPTYSEDVFRQIVGSIQIGDIKPQTLDALSGAFPIGSSEKAFLVSCAAHITQDRKTSAPSSLNPTIINPIVDKQVAIKNHGPATNLLKGLTKGPEKIRYSFKETKEGLNMEVPAGQYGFIVFHKATKPGIFIVNLETKIPEGSQLFVKVNIVSKKGDLGGDLNITNGTEITIPDGTKDIRVEVKFDPEKAPSTNGKVNGLITKFELENRPNNEIAGGNQTK